MWEISNSHQALSFLLFTALGVIAAVIYDIFKALRLVKRHGVLAVMFEDLGYFLLLTLATFTLLIFRTNGQPRAFAYFAEAAGFALWRISVSRKFLKLLLRVFGASFALASKIRSAILRHLGKISVKIKKIFKKLQNCAKKGLKESKAMVYNHLNKIIDK